MSAYPSRKSAVCIAVSTAQILTSASFRTTPLYARDSYHDVFLPAIFGVIKERHWDVWEAHLEPLEKVSSARSQAICREIRRRLPGFQASTNLSELLMHLFRAMGVLSFALWSTLPSS